MERSQLRSESPTVGVGGVGPLIPPSRVRGIANRFPRATLPPGDGADSQSPPEVKAPTGHSAQSTEEAARPLRELRAAVILAIAYARARNAYAPSWGTMPNKPAWKAAARALLSAIDEGRL